MNDTIGHRFGQWVAFVVMMLVGCGSEDAPTQSAVQDASSNEGLERAERPAITLDDDHNRFTKGVNYKKYELKPSSGLRIQGVEDVILPADDGSDDTPYWIQLSWQELDYSKSKFGTWQTRRFRTQWPGAEAVVLDAESLQPAESDSSTTDAAFPGFQSGIEYTIAVGRVGPHPHKAGEDILTDAPWSGTIVVQ